MREAGMSEHEDRIVELLGDLEVARAQSAYFEAEARFVKASLRALWGLELKELKLELAVMCA